MGRPARKKVYAETKAAERAKLQAQKEHERKKPLEEKLLDFAKANSKEIPKWAALLGMTILVKNTIDSIPNLKEALKQRTMFKTRQEVQDWFQEALRVAQKGLGGQDWGKGGVG